MSDVSEVKYAELHTRYREASMLADKYELIAKTHQDVNESLRKTNDDLRRMLLEKDEENAKLRELVRDAIYARDDADWASIVSTAIALGVEVDE